MKEVESKSYVRGERAAYSRVERIINEAIKKNGGAFTALQLLNVFNEITSHVHYTSNKLEQELKEIEKPVKTEDTLLEVIRELNSGLGEFFEDIIVLKGGVKL